ncbi:hypothetical protein AB833_08450 [Chromatiales bacterium (ex Bugula neritina AB1)]|nr:hypothetical protein AB833_08450 [Chromatiales bacterium (ex Bugula neritina AB1)]
MLGSLISGLVATYASGFSISVSIPQDVPAAILAIMAATIANESAQPASIETFATVVVVMAVSTFLTGTLLWLFGHYNLGRLVRFLPYPVVGGFMAGTGWLLITGGFGVVTEGAFSPALLLTESLLQWVPAILFAIVLLAATRRYSNPLLSPLIIVATLFLFYLTLALANGGMANGLEKALGSGWLLGPLPDAELWQPVTREALQNANWVQVFSSSGTMITIFVISVVSLMLNASGLEIVTNSDVDLNRELKCIGCANMASSVVGSSASFQMLSLSSLMHRLGSKTRLAGVTVAVIIAITLFLGADILSNFPKMIAAGFLIFMGLGFLFEWIYDGWFKLSRTDYLLVWLILGTIATQGILEGVIVGVLVAVVLFVIAYTRTNVVRKSFTRDNYQGYTLHPPRLEKYLQERGNGLYVLELQGFIFFGMAHQLLEQLKVRINDRSRYGICTILLDFHLVTGIDSSASYSFLRLYQITRQAGITVGFSNANQRVRGNLCRSLSDSNNDVLMFDDLDQAVTWFDNRAIEAIDVQQQNFTAIPLLSHFQTELSQSGTNEQISQRLQRFMKLEKYKSGAVLLQENDPVDYIYFIEPGQVIVQTVLADGIIKTLRVQGAGTVFGEIGIYNSATATATVVVSADAHLYSMSADSLRQMDAKDPELAVVVHRLIATTLGRKLTQANSARRD